MPLPSPRSWWIITLTNTLTGDTMLTVLFLALVPMAPIPLYKTAPVPIVKPITMEELVGEWWMQWDHSACLTMLHAGGGYSCIHLGRTWQGRWNLRSDVLEINETPNGGSVTTSKWEVHLKRAKMLYGGAGFIPVGIGPATDFSLSRQIGFLTRKE